MSQAAPATQPPSKPASMRECDGRTPATTLLSRCWRQRAEGFPVGVWRSALDLRGSRVDDTFFDEAESVLDADETASGDPQALALLAPTTMEFPYEVWKWPVGLLLTATKLVFVRRKGFARRFQIEKINRDDCPRYGRPQPLGPSTFRTRFDHDSLGPIWAFFGTYREAEALSDYFASDYNRRRSSPEAPSVRPTNTRPVNMLPSDNVYLPSALEANGDYSERGWQIRVAAVRMQEPGELEVALVVPGEWGAVREGLDALPGPTEILEVVQCRLAMFGHSVHPQYFSEAMWRDAEASGQWQYSD